MTKPPRLNLKDPTVQLRHRGFSLDDFVDVVLKNAYQCSFVYADGTRRQLSTYRMRRHGPNEITAFVVDGRIHEVRG